MSTFAIYYLETNLICMVIMAFMLHSYARESKGMAEAKWFNASIIGVEIYCLADILSALFKNQPGTGARTILWISNTIYIAFPLFLAIFWHRYSYNRMIRLHAFHKGKGFLDRLMLVSSLIALVLALSSPISHFSFFLDESNGYHRSLGAYLVPFFSYVFLLIEWIKAQFHIKKGVNLEIRTEARALSLMPIPCLFFSLLQVLYYGITTAQVGFTLGYMLVFLRHQKNSISMDELTGLSNRRQFDLAVDRLVRGSGSAFVAMVDVDGFKGINDSYGHAEGDNMLKAAALLLHRCCESESLEGNFHVYRYGGDEFTILASSFETDNIGEVFENVVEREVERWNATSHVEYQMSLSVGTASGRLSEESINQLITKADKQMYLAKGSKSAYR